MDTEDGQRAVSSWGRVVRRAVARARAHARRARRPVRWLGLGVVIGAISGGGAIAFRLSISWATKLFLALLVGYTPPDPLGEGQPIIHAMARPWALPLVTALGGLLAGLVVYWLAPGAEGHGTDAAITSVHRKRGRMRPQVPFVKLVASAITIGSGGSGGREGPSAQISAGCMAIITEWLHSDVRERRTAITVGIGSGIGAIFGAPLGGAVLAVEILYIRDFEIEALLPALVASLVAYTLFSAYFGGTPMFGAHVALHVGPPLRLVYYAFLGLLCGLFGLLYSYVYYGTAHRTHPLPVPVWLRAAVGGLIVGVIGLGLPAAIHTGYGWVQIVMARPSLMALPLWVILVLPFAKIVTTSLSIAGGGSGGLFGPGIVVGAAIGASFWRLGRHVLPQMPAGPEAFVIIGMMALFGSIAHAPIAVLLMIAEMTGNLSLLGPAMIAVSVALAVVGDRTIYSAQLLDRAAAARVQAESEDGDSS